MVNFRSKTGLAVLFSVLLLVVVAYVLIVPPLAARVRADAEDDVQRAAALVSDLQRVHAYDLVALAKRISLYAPFAPAVGLAAENERRQAVFDAIGEIDQFLRREEQKADFLAVVDPTGVVIARDLNIEDMYGQKLAYKAVDKALRGQAASDVWYMRNRMMRGAAAPIIVDGRIRAAIVIAYDFTSAEARADARKTRAEILYLMEGAVRASSFAQGDSEDSTRVKAVGTVLVDPTGVAAKALAGGSISDVFSVDLPERHFLAKAGPFPPPAVIRSAEPVKEGRNSPAEENGELSGQRAGFAVLVDLNARMAGVTMVRYAFAAITLFLLFAVFGTMWMVRRHYLMAEDRLELGVNEILSGNVDYVFDAHEDFEGLANALNVMLARLLGRVEPGAEDDGESSWRPDVLTIEPLVGAEEAGVDASQLAAEDEENYLRRTFEEYADACASAGVSVDGLTPDWFNQKLKANEAVFRAKHKCELVRFVVRKRSGQVVLQPIVLA